MEHQAHGAGEKKGIMENIKEKLPGGHGDHKQTAGTHGQQGHAGTATHGAPATGGAYGQQGRTGTTGTGLHGADAGEKKGVKENIKDKLPGGHGDHQQTAGTYGQQGHTGTAAHGTPVGGGTYEQQGHTGVTGTGTHGTGENKGVMENIKEKLPGGHADHQQTTDTYGQHGHTGVTGTETHGTTATGGTYGQQGHTGTTGTGTHGTDGIGEKKSLMDKIKDNLPGQH